MPELGCWWESPARQQRGRNAAQGHGPPPATPGSCQVPGQIPAPLPGLVLDVQLFPLGARRLESKARRLGLPRQTPALGTAAPARPLRQVLARALLGCLLAVPPRDAGTPPAPFAGENRDLVPPAMSCILVAASALELLRHPATAPGLAPCLGMARKRSGHCRTGTLALPVHRACRECSAAVVFPGLRQLSEQRAREPLVFPFPAAIPAARSLFPGTEGLAARFPGQGMGCMCSCFGGVSVET